MKMSKKTFSALISLVGALVLVLSILGITYAVWSRNPTAEKTVDIPGGEPNPSEKYIIFAGLNSGGNFTDNASLTVAYAAVGYDGLVAEVVIPSLHEGKPVTRIAISDGIPAKKRFAGNPIITSITVPESVTEITAGACQNMLLLNKVVILGSDPITFGEFAFANCPYLNEITSSRSISGAGIDSYLF